MTGVLVVELNRLSELLQRFLKIFEKIKKTLDIYNVL